MEIKTRTNQHVSSIEEGADGDLKTCMKCRYFWGNDSRCMNSQCCIEEKVELVVKEKSECDDCPYKQGGSYCFPCMKKLLSKKVTKADG